MVEGKVLRSKTVDGKKTNLGRFLTVSILTVVVFSILVKLGFWQMARADEKRAIHRNIEQRANQDVMPLENLTLAEKAQPTGIKVRVPAQPVLKHYLLLDNQHHHGEVGYLALQLVKSDTEKYLLMERGFVPALERRDMLPQVDWLTQPVEIEGRLYKRSANPMSQDLYMEEGVPSRIQNLNFPQLEQEWQIPIEPYVIQPNTVASNLAEWGYAQPWKPVSLSPEKHVGYAVQWFAMAGVLLLINVILLVRALKR